MSSNEPKFYECKECNTIIEEIAGNNNEISCNGNPLKCISPNTSDGASEKHLPIVEQNGNQITVKVGSVFHPMTESHSIEWVYLQTKKGCQRINLNYSDEPSCTFLVPESDTAIAVYSYCNLHGLWKTTL